MSTTTKQTMLDVSRDFGRKILSIDKLSVVLYVTWLWAWAGLYITKVFETFFKVILAMPDSWLSIPANMCNKIQTTQRKRINILNAATENGQITNRFKLFLKYYWEKASGDTAFDVNGFSMDKASEFLNCSLLYCSYVISNGEDMPIEEFMNNVKRAFIVRDNGVTAMSYETDMSDRERVPLGHVNFDDEAVQEPVMDYLNDLDLSDDSDENKEDANPLVDSGAGLGAGLSAELDIGLVNEAVH